MGSFEPPTWAYMVPIVTETGAFPEDDPARAGAIHVYRIRPNQVDAFQAKSSGDAFFPGGAGDGLDDALRSAGWAITYEEGDYLWTAVHPFSGARVRYIEGDVYAE